MNLLGHTRRTGHSLIELLVVMSISIVVLTLAVTFLSRMMHIHSQSSRFLQAERTGLRLSRQLRSDLLLASHVGLTEQAEDDGPIGVTLYGMQNGDPNIDYHFSPEGVLRMTSVSDDKYSHENYRLPQGTRWRVQLLSEPDRLVVEAISAAEASSSDRRAPPPAWRVPFELRVEQVVGRLTWDDSTDDDAAAAPPADDAPTAENEPPQEESP
ncbi:PulJ/GspJ family protein [Aeoliella mucimassa]|uniref:General secretion pathway protein J n=1 Tax=Aeoliella mucimassa TaxID=2527972 RepID=A0A518ANB5_9BACT|nr:type II secretion system protein [Aeoliella mucimassa]QDU56217.1 hypothetical protein Pan181_24250 [Aeoliella mucimassa]